MPPLPPVTKALMLICTALFCVDLLRVVDLQAWFALWPVGSGNFLPWQLLTYAFLNKDMLSLFINMLGLWMCGAELERLWGQPRFIKFLLASVLTAALMQLLMAAATGSMRPTEGASGALYGLLLAFGMLFPNRTIMPLFPPIPMKARTFLLVFGAVDLILGIWGPGWAHFAHLGGMLGGFLMIRFWRGQAPFTRRRR